MTGIDVVADVHGHADHLEALLRALGYRCVGRAWRHPQGRTAVFLGDLVDRGPQQLDVVDIVRRMIEAGSGLALMGNHEFNALAYATEDPDRPGEHYRPRRGSNVAHHAAFIAAVGGADTSLHRELCGFFRTLPLWADLTGLRLVHACWDAGAMAALASCLDPDHRLTEAGLHGTQRKGTPLFEAAERLLKGAEMALPAGVTFLDWNGSRRRRARTRWWDPAATTVRSACAEPTIDPDLLPDEPLPTASRVTLDDTAPVLFGHYWLAGAPRLLSDRRSCLDFSVARGGVLCGYRFEGEDRLEPGRLVWTAA